MEKEKKNVKNKKNREFVVTLRVDCEQQNKVTLEFYFVTLCATDQKKTDFSIS